MAQGKTVSTTVTINNMKTNTVIKTVEQVIIGGVLVPDPKEVEPGVNTNLLKN